MNIITTIANSDDLENPGEGRLGKMVFFDLLGHFMVYYPLKLGEMINVLTIAAVILNLYRKVKAFRSKGEWLDTGLVVIIVTQTGFE